MSEKPYFFAVVGDVHGHFFKMIEMLTGWEAATGNRLRYVLQVGDIEPHRGREDADSMDAPEKYRQAGDFRFFYRGEAQIPWPMVFIGGNHEPNAWLEQHPRGAELIPGFHYLGRSGVFTLPDGLVVAGLSGIYRPSVWPDNRPAWSPEMTLPCKDLIGFTRGDIHRLIDLLDVSPDFLLLHDWPVGIDHVEGLITEPRGNQPARDLAEALQPRFIFCGHLHRKHRTVLPYRNGAMSRVACMRAVYQGWESLAIFEGNDGEIREVNATQ
ncbi:metallophosphoesterase [Acanthopleuribacter pedis]|uniref:Metallophosphoesterase n=1 Tax=Acanthopleuribacter pedis TaxID=442870 RepID=A0A8J7Q3T0_9BACT|nr:metallophosphoesterase [Acanthopleuribacter pedis]MBO1318735.1 metallophosphoesterase [Acanthopleuribacter pedis]